MIPNIAERLKPKCGNLIEHRALVRDCVRQNYVKGRDAIGGDKEKRLAKIKNFAHLATA